jgi:hypothetical protein
MNTEIPQSAQDAASPRLPELSDARIDEIESALFADIAHERTKAGSRRRRVWLGVGAAAAVIVVAAVMTPFVAGVLSPSATGGEAIAPAVGVGGSEIARDAAPDGALNSDASGGSESSVGSSAPGATGVVDRQIIATGSATVVVDDVAAAARGVAAAAVGMGGYVESMTIGQSGVVVPMDGGMNDTMPYPAAPDGGWVTVRVPSDQLTVMMEQLSGFGEVTASSITRQDVTDQTIDLKARIEASQASVDRLTELMAQATSTADLIAAESALAERQATLESYQQQLEYLSGQVDMSTLTVNVAPRSIPVTADPAGFGDGLAAGWNGLVATLNALVVSLGFLIPWIVVIAVAAAVVWAVITLVRRGRDRRHRTAHKASEHSDGPEL